MNVHVPHNRQLLNNAFSLPGERIDRRTTTFGVYRSDGAPADLCHIKTPSWTAVPQNLGRITNSAVRFFGPALFAGSADKQFGFTLLNSLGRLWALDELPPETTIVYAAKPTKEYVDFGVLAAVLRGLGLKNPVTVVKQPAHFEELHLAEELFGETRAGRGTPQFYDWIDLRWPARVPVDPIQKVYVSRRGLGPEAGRFACEDHLEQLLIAQGYRVYEPEKHPIGHQVETYQAAGRLVFAESSALHLFSLIRRAEQHVAVVQRRRELPHAILEQLYERPGSEPRIVDAVAETWRHPRRGEHLGKSVLDFDKLGASLSAGGFIAPDGWHAPASEAVQLSLRDGLSADQPLMSEVDWRAWKKHIRRNRS